MFKGFLRFYLSLKLAKFNVILFQFSIFSILLNLEINHFSTYYFSFRTFLVPIQYQHFLSLLYVVPVACRSWTIQKIIVQWFASSPKEIINQTVEYGNEKFCGTNQSYRISDYLFFSQLAI